jgi:hypothetical protein
VLAVPRRQAEPEAGRAPRHDQVVFAVQQAGAEGPRALARLRQRIVAARSGGVEESAGKSRKAVSQR